MEGKEILSEGLRWRKLILLCEESLGQFTIRKDCRLLHTV